MYANGIVCRTNTIVSNDNIFTEDGVFTAPGLLENIAQTAAAGAGYAAVLKNIPPQPGYIGAVKNFEVFSLPTVNDELDTEVIFVERVFNVVIVQGYVRCNQVLLASCEMKIFIG